MKRMIVCVTLLLAAAALLQAQVFPFKVYEKTLDNGFRILCVPLSQPGLVAYYSIVRTGSRDEYEPGHTGFAHFFEHMMFRGTKNFPADKYNQLITAMGANANAFTGDDQTVYHLVFAKQDLEQVMMLESDRFRNLFYEEREFKTEAGAVLGEYLKNKTNPFALLNESLYDTAFDKHTYKHTTMGFESDIRAMPTMYEYSLSFYRRYYRPENVVLVVTGDIVPDQVFALAAKYYKDWSKGYEPPKIESEPEQTAPRGKTIQYPGKTLPMLAVAYKSPAYDAKSTEFVAANLLGDIMFGGTSDLFNKLVLQEQKVQNFGANFAQNRDPNLNTIFAVIKDKADVPYVKQQIAETIRRFQTEPMAAAKLDSFRKSLKYGFLMQLQSTEDIAQSLIGPIVLTGGIGAIDDYYATLDRITPEDLRQAANKYFTDNRKTEVLLLGE